MYIPIIDDIGSFTNVILFIFTVTMLTGRIKYLNLYLIIYLLNGIINYVLNNNIKANRLTERRDIIGNNGMRSTDIGVLSFSTLYLYLVTKSKSFLIISSFISMFSILNHYMLSRANVNQLVTHIIIGSLFAYVSYNISTIYFTYK